MFLKEYALDVTLEIDIMVMRSNHLSNKSVPANRNHFVFVTSVGTLSAFGWRRGKEVGTVRTVGLESTLFGDRVSKLVLQPHLQFVCGLRNTPHPTKSFM